MGQDSEKIAVVCGALRDTLEFSFILDRLIEEKNSGKLNRILFSTWNEELKQDHPLFSKIINSGIEVIESPSPRTGGYGNIQRQKKSLFQALIQLPSDAVVLKLRTDKCAVLLDSFLSRMADPLIATQSPNSTYQRKVVIVRTASTFPFMSDDFAFLGRCSDLRQMTMQEESLLIHNPRSAPTAEMMWMYAALSRRFPLLDAFFSMAPLRQFSLQLRKTSQQSIAQIPDLVLGFLSYYWQINADHYEIIRKKNFEYETDTVKAILNPVEQSPLARDLGMYITVHADGVLQCAAGALKCLQNTVLSCNPTEVVSTMIESLCPSTKEANVVPIVKLACGETSPNVQEKSALATALQYHQHTQENIADIDALEKIILECGNKIAFPRLIAQIGLKYCHGSDDLPKHTELGRAWLRLAAGMREPSAFRELVHSYPSDEEAIMDAEIQRIFALQETRDPDIFVRLCRAFLFKGVTSPYLKSSDLVRGLQSLAQQSTTNGAAELLQEFSEQLVCRTK